MKKINTNLNELKLVGITCRTSNIAEMNPNSAKIGQTLQHYFHGAMADKINNRQNPGVTYCIYTNYESDVNGEYTYFVGEKVSSFDNVSSDFQELIIPAQNYVKFTTEAGPMPKVCIEAWQKIWAMDSDEMDGTRNYIADFEIYDARAQDPSHTVLDIFIGIES